MNTRDGVLVLSENAGAHEELGEWAVDRQPVRRVGPGRRRCTRRSSMEPAERQRRARRRSARQVRAHDVHALARRPARPTWTPVRVTFRHAMMRRAFARRRDRAACSMVDVGAKPVAAPPRRRARRRADGAGDRCASWATCRRATPSTTAQLAGIMAAKRTSELIPLCHPLAALARRRRAAVADDGVEITRVGGDDRADRRRDGSAHRRVGRRADDLRHGEGDRQADDVRGRARREDEGDEGRGADRVRPRLARARPRTRAATARGAACAPTATTSTRRVVADEAGEIAAAIEELAAARRSC